MHTAIIEAIALRKLGNYEASRKADSSTQILNLG